MKSRATLSLVEQAIMVLVFSVAAAICLRVFVYADSLSKENTALDMACLRSQNVAETLKFYHGDMERTAQVLGGSAEDGVWTLELDADWIETESEPTYIIRAESVPTKSEYLGGARISVQGDSEIFSLQVRWQEGD